MKKETRDQRISRMKDNGLEADCRQFFSWLDSYKLYKFRIKLMKWILELNKSDHRIILKDYFKPDEVIKVIETIELFVVLKFDQVNNYHFELGKTKEGDEFFCRVDISHFLTAKEVKPKTKKKGVKK